MSIEQDAKEYIETLLGQPNGWGQYVHPVYGVSHVMLYKMYKQYGEAEFNAAVEKELKARRQAHAVPNSNGTTTQQ